MPKDTLPWHDLRVTNNIFCDKQQNLCENGKDTRVLRGVKSLVRVTKSKTKMSRVVENEYKESSKVLVLTSTMT